MITALDATRPSLSGVSASAGHPTDALAFFEAKQKHLPKAEWLKLQEAARKRAFTVAWTSSAQVLSDVKASLEKALAEGQSFQDWKKGLAAQLAGRWSTTDAHLETIFRNNIQAAYNAGRWRTARNPLTLKLRPFWKLTILLDDRTSKYCRPLASPPVILPAEDPWWDSNYPPRHHRCRAVVVTLTRREAERQGTLSKAPKTPPQLGWGSTEGFADWQPDPAGYDPEIFKRARQAAPAAPPVASPAPVAAPSSFEEIARTTPLTRVQPVGEESVNFVFKARLGDRDVYAKPGHGELDPAKAVDRHSAVRTTLEALGADAMATPAALMRSEAALHEAAKMAPGILAPENKISPKMFVTQAAPAGAASASTRSVATLDKVTDGDRLIGALVDFLHGNGDRHDGNVLVDPNGRLTLIDHDVIGHNVPASVFFPGGGLHYRSHQKSIADLPERARKYVSEVANASVSDLKKRYHQTKKAAAAMKARAQSIVRSGLDAALVEHGAQAQVVGAHHRVEDRIIDVERR